MPSDDIMFGIRKIEELIAIKRNSDKRRMEETKETNKFMYMMKKMCIFDPRNPNKKKCLDLLYCPITQSYCMGFDTIKIFYDDANNPSSISKYLDASIHLKYRMIYQGLLLVQHDNTPALNEFKRILQVLFDETIVNRTSVKDTMKICTLIESIPSLQTIHQSLDQLILKIKQLQHDEEEDDSTQPDSLVMAGAPPIPEMKVLRDLYEIFSNPHNDLDWESYANDHLEEVETAHSNSMLVNPTIVTQNIDGIFAKWLKTINLHKYQWFFNGLSYLEIMLIDEKNIKDAIAKVNKKSNTTYAIPKHIQKDICIKTKALKNRPIKIRNAILVLNSDMEVSQLFNIITYMQDILQYPIPNRNCMTGEVLLNEIVIFMEYFILEINTQLFAIKFINPESVLVTIIKKYFECIFLILENQVFMGKHIKKVKFLKKMLIDIVQSMPYKK